MTAATVTPAAPLVGERVELGRYRTPHGKRLLVGQRIHGIVRIADVPAAERGRRYIVERGLTRRAELDAVVTDYLDQAEELGDCPMRASRVI